LEINLETEITRLKVSTPGRVCLFGEHQDYLNLPIIAAAISKRISVEGSHRNDNIVNIELPDINASEKFSLDDKIKYDKERDYFKSCINILMRDGYSFSKGFECIVKGDIPIKAGTSSSSALVITWVNFLARISDQHKVLPPEKIADIAYRAEVLEFSEPGGMMDQYTTAFGGIIGLSSYPEIRLNKINFDMGAFVLGNSAEPKDTMRILNRVKNEMLKIIKILRIKYSTFSPQTITYDELDSFSDDLNPNQLKLLKGTIKNRDITKEAEKVFNQKPLDDKYIGKLLTDHQQVLRDVLNISTPKIDSMIDTALDAGAYGAKINGSGGGGCMFAYAPENSEKVLETVKKISPDSYIVRVDEGTREELL